MKLTHSLELEQAIQEYNDAVDIVKKLPPGDERAHKLFQLEKSKNLILHADRLYRSGHSIFDLINIARDNIFIVIRKDDTQLDLPFNPKIK